MRFYIALSLTILLLAQECPSTRLSGNSRSDNASSKSFVSRNWLREIKNEIAASRVGNTRQSDSLSDGVSVEVDSEEESDEETDETEGTGKKVIEFNGKIDEEGECQERIEIVLSKMYNEKIQCKDTTFEECVSGYSTLYVPKKIKECTEDFKKECHIHYEATVVEQEVKVCQEVAERNCDIEGEIICTEFPVSICVTNSNEETGEEDINCDVENRKVCGPDTCSITTKEECSMDTKDVVQEIPKEKCYLHPKETCRTVTKLIPNLKSKEDCIKVPKQICQKFKTNSRSVEKPVVQIMCIKPTGPWKAFSEWGECAGKCGMGIQERSRECEVEGQCKGFSIQTQICDTGISCKEEEENDSSSDDLLLEDEESGEVEDTPVSRRGQSEACPVANVRFISEDYMEETKLPLKDSISSHVRLCQIQCRKKEGCQFFHIKPSPESRRSCVLFKAISAVADNSKGYVAGLRHCLDSPTPVQDEEVNEESISA